MSGLKVNDKKQSKPLLKSNGGRAVQKEHSNDYSETRKERKESVPHVREPRLVSRPMHY